MAGEPRDCSAVHLHGAKAACKGPHTPSYQDQDGPSQSNCVIQVINMWASYAAVYAAPCSDTVIHVVPCCHSHMMLLYMLLAHVTWCCCMMLPHGIAWCFMMFMIDSFMVFMIHSWCCMSFCQLCITLHLYSGWWNVLWWSQNGLS